MNLEFGEKWTFDLDPSVSPTVPQSAEVRAYTGVLSSSTSVFRHCPVAVSQIRLQVESRVRRGQNKGLALRTYM